MSPDPSFPTDFPTSNPGRRSPVRREPGFLTLLTLLLVVGCRPSTSVRTTPSDPGSEFQAIPRNRSGQFPLSDARGIAAVFQSGAGELPRGDIPEVYRRGGYLATLYSPSGLRITDDYPANHLHHHGIWTSWTKTRFEGRSPDFWNMGDRKGRVECVAVDRTWTGPAESGLVARNDYVDLLAQPPRVVLHETLEIRVGSESGARWRVTDVSIRQTCATGSPLELPEYHYGGLGFRGHGDWNGGSHAQVLTSEGITNRVAAHGTRPRWIWVGGLVEGRLTGLVLFGHPGNFRAPQPLRVHPEEPFVCFSPQQMGTFTLQPGSDYVARYRLATVDGLPDREEIERIWKEFASSTGPKSPR